jgi:acetyltransferase-like isoleucine patch superfamily enzyme
MNHIAHTAKIYKNVTLGDHITIEDYAIIGIPPVGKNEHDYTTTIGDHAIIRAHSIIYAGNTIGTHFQTGNNVNIRENNTIGNHVSIGTKTVIEFHTTIHDNVRIHSQAFIPEYCTLHEHCWIGPNVVLTNAKYPQSTRSKDFLTGVIIEKQAKIGANSTILPGIHIGQNALVGAGSVVSKHVKENTVVAGNPAKLIDTIQNIRYPNGEPAYPE